MADALVPAAEEAGYRRSNDVDVAALKQWARSHEQRCSDRELAAKDYRQTIIDTVTAVEKRVGRLETGVITTLVAIVTGGGVVIGFLVKIVLHLPG